MVEDYGDEDEDDDLVRYNLLIKSMHCIWVVVHVYVFNSP